jgi:hypothetical protein
LSEVVVALGILAAVALVLIGVFLALIRTSAKNREQAMAELLTESLLEKATAAGPPDWGVGAQIGTRLEAVLQQDGSRFFYQVDPLSILPEPSDPDGHSWQVTVTVGWWTRNPAGSLERAREGFGNQYVKGVRSVYVRDGDRV